MRQKTSKYKGVSRFRNKWRVRFRNYTMGFFETELEAGLAYNRITTHPNELSDEFECCECNQIKNRSEFYEDLRKRTGISSTCKSCQSTLTGINKFLERLGLQKDCESSVHIKNMRILKLLETGTITKNEARNLYNTETTFGCFNIRLKR